MERWPLNEGYSEVLSSSVCDNAQVQYSINALFSCYHIDFALYIFHCLVKGGYGNFQYVFDFFIDCIL